MAGMRFLLRLMALMFLAVAVIAAVIDTARSLAASTLTLTSLGKGWTDFSPTTLTATQNFVQAKLPAVVYDPVFLFLLSMPAAAVMAIFAAAFYAIGAKPERPFGDFTAGR
jgi:hypothetical protein